jgi:MEMO1 family protein
MILPRATRLPAVAGAFYPRSADTLARDVDAMLAEAALRQAQGERPAQGRVRALVVPHAGFIYSGPVAASAYALLAAQPKPKRVLLLGPSHHVPLRGLALPEAKGMSTPLGEVPLDAAGVETASKQGVGWSALAHVKEHSLEVQLPFLQRVLGDDFTLIPVVVGRALADDVARVIDALADDETLVLVSSDLSHYLPWAAAKDVDQQTAELILAYDFEALDGDQACGAEPLRGLLLWARNKGLKPRQLDLRNSGDTAGDKGRVVGYGSFAFEDQ